MGLSGYIRIGRLPDQATPGARPGTETKPTYKIPNELKVELRIKRTD